MLWRIISHSLSLLVEVYGCVCGSRAATRPCPPSPPDRARELPCAVRWQRPWSVSRALSRYGRRKGRRHRAMGGSPRTLSDHEGSRRRLLHRLIATAKGAEFPPTGALAPPPPSFAFLLSPCVAWQLDTLTRSVRRSLILREGRARRTTSYNLRGCVRARLCC